MNDWLIVTVSALVGVAVPELALGASAGSLYFLLSTRDESQFRKILFMVIGWLTGYFFGQPFLDGGWAGLIATMGSAFSIVVMLQVTYSLDNREAGLPPFLVWIADFYHKVRKN